MEALERVQIRFTRLLPGLEFTRYDDRVGKQIVSSGVSEGEWRM